MGMSGTYSGKEHKTSGRPIDMTWIGSMGNHLVELDKFEGKFWFCAAFRRHPTSDKLVRSRLLMLIMNIFNRSLIVQESRIFLIKEHHNSRYKRFMNLCFYKYVASDKELNN